MQTKIQTKINEIKGDILSVYSDLISQIPTSDYVHFVTNKSIKNYLTFNNV